MLHPNQDAEGTQQPQSCQTKLCMSPLHTKASLPSKDMPEHKLAAHTWSCQALCQHRGAYSPLGSACCRAAGGVRVSAGGGSDSKVLGGTQEMELGGREWCQHHCEEQAAEGSGEIPSGPVCECNSFQRETSKRLYQV